MSEKPTGLSINDFLKVEGIGEGEKVWVIKEVVASQFTRAMNGCATAAGPRFK
jgi:hypothetical protein